MTKYSKTFYENSLRSSKSHMRYSEIDFWLRPLHSLSSSPPVAAHVDAVDLQLGRARTHLEVAPRRWPQMRLTSQCPQPGCHFSQPEQDMGVSENSGTPKSSISIGFSIINHPFWGILIFGNTHINNHFYCSLHKN